MNRSATAQFLFEAGAAAANYQWEGHRTAAARAAGALGIEELACSSEARTRMLLAIREAVIALAISSPLSRERLAVALRALVDAARTEEQPVEPATPRPGRAEPRLYWVEGDE